MRRLVGYLFQEISVRDRGIIAGLALAVIFSFVAAKSSSAVEQKIDAQSTQKSTQELD